MMRSAMLAAVVNPKAVFLALTVMAGIGESALAASEEAITLERTEEIRVAKELDRRVDGLIAKVRQCAAAGLAPAAECHCYYPSKLDATLNSYEAMLARHPDWEDRTLLWWEDNRAYPSNLQLRGLKVRLSRPCS